MERICSHSIKFFPIRVVPILKMIRRPKKPIGGLKLYPFVKHGGKQRSMAIHLQFQDEGGVRCFKGTFSLYSKNICCGRF